MRVQVSVDVWEEEALRLEEEWFVCSPRTKGFSVRAPGLIEREREARQAESGCPGCPGWGSQQLLGRG